MNIYSLSDKYSKHVYCNQEKLKFANCNDKHNRLKVIGIILECLPELVPRLIQFFVPSLLEQKHQDNVSFQK